jgi:hypothetical protein
MNAFEIGMNEAMEKVAGPGLDKLKAMAVKAGKKVVAPVRTFRGLRNAPGGMSVGGALYRTAAAHPGHTMAAAGGLGLGAGYLAGKSRQKTAAAGNPAQAVKQSLPTGAPEAQRFAPHLNQGGGMPPAHQAGPVQSQPQPWPGHVNVGNKSPGQQVPGPVARDTSPDTGEKGKADEGTMTRTKSAAFVAGIAAVLDDNDE